MMESYIKRSVAKTEKILFWCQETCFSISCLPTGIQTEYRILNLYIEEEEERRERESACP